MPLKTSYQQDQEKRNASLYKDWLELSANPENTKGGITDYLMKKYKIHARSTIWQIRQKMERAQNEK